MPTFKKKICKVCKKNKRLSDYRKYRRDCKKCEASERKEYHKAYHKENYKPKRHFPSKEDNLISGWRNKIIYCSCGAKYKRRNRSVHLNTKKHINYRGTYDIKPFDIESIIITGKDIIIKKNSSIYI